MLRERELFVLKTNTEKVLVGSLYYNMGGMNYFTGTIELRGYYFSVTPEVRTERCREFEAFTGIKMLIQEASRFNTKTLSELIVNQELERQLIENVCTKNKLEARNADRK